MTVTGLYPIVLHAPCRERVASTTILSPGGGIFMRRHSDNRFACSEDWFWSKVDIRGPDECWLWTASRCSLTDGPPYGAASRGDGSGRMELAHRRAYSLAVGSVPSPLHVCHDCDTTLCCNPRHLFAGTRQGNMDDMVAKGRSPSGERNHAAKLTPERVRLIREALAAGRPQSAIGLEFGVTHSVVSNIKTGVLWRHVS